MILNWTLNWIIFWRNSNIELNRFGYRSPLGSTRSLYMRKYGKAFVKATSCILKHASLQNDNLVSSDTSIFFLTKSAMRFLEKALSWNVQNPPESEMRNLLGWTFIGTRITLHPCPVCRRVFDTEYPPVCIWISWRLAFGKQMARPGDENVNNRRSQKPNLASSVVSYSKLLHVWSVLQKLAQVSSEASSSLFEPVPGSRYPRLPL